MYRTDLSGTYEVLLADGTSAYATLPGTLDENHIGYADQADAQWHPADGFGASDERNQNLLDRSVIKTRLTRNYVYDGAATFKRNFSYHRSGDKRVFLDIERARKITSCKINGKEALQVLQGTLSTSYSFELTEYLCEENVLEITSDNTYPGWPKDAICYSSAATNETQTNWNGLLGELALREEEKDYIASVRVYPKRNYLNVIVEIDVASDILEKDICVESEVLRALACQKVRLEKGCHEIIFEQLLRKEDIAYWDEYVCVSFLVQTATLRITVIAYFCVVKATVRYFRRMVTCR